MLSEAVVPERTFHVLHELAVATSGVLDPQTVAQIATDAARELLRADHAALFWWDPEVEELVRLGDNDAVHQRGPNYRLRDRGATSAAFRLRRPLLIDDYVNWEMASPGPVQRGIRSAASVPLIVRDKAVGALTVRALTPRLWTSEDAQLLSLLAAQVAPGLEAARLHAESERRRAEAEALAELVRVGATERDLGRAIGLICEQAAKLIGADYDGIALIQEDGTRAWRGMWGNRSGDWNRTTRGRGTGPLAAVTRARRSVILENLGDDPLTMPQTHAREGGKTVLSTPLMMRDRVVGALSLGWRTSVRPGAAQVRLAEAVAGYAVTVLENARAYGEQQAARARAEAVAAVLSQRERALRALHDIAVEAGGLQDTTRLGALVVDSSCAMLGFDAAGLYWWDVCSQALHPLAESATGPDIPSSIPAGQGASGQAYASGLPVVVEDYRAWPRKARPYGNRVRSIVAVPLRVEERTLGVLVVRSYTQRQIGPEEVHLLELLAAQVAPAIEAARLHAESERQRHEAEALAELARQGAVEHDTERVIALVCEQATRLTGAHYAGIRLLADGGGLKWRGMAGNRSQRWRMRTRSSGRGSAGQAIRSGRTIISRVEDLAARGASPDPLSVRNSEGGLVELATPLVYRGAARGALVLGWRSATNPSPDQVRLAEALAGYATVILENAHAHLALAQQALYDELTGLPNRRLLQDRLEQAMLASRRDGRPIALLLMDLDRFKEVNDTLGHAAGDGLLRELGERLRNALRSSDTVARLGGDEFAVVLTSLSDQAGAAIAAAKLLDSVGEPLLLRGHSMQVAGSIGIALFPEHGDDAETLLRRADVAMYVAKRAGSGIATYAPEMDRDRADRLALVHDLRRGVEENELILEFQPQLSVASGVIDGVEALVRWQHPEYGLIAPAQFIPLAEQMGLIKQLSRWVLEAAFEQRSRWLALGRDLPMSVNLSMRDLLDPDLPGFLANLARTYDERPTWLTAEITEGAVMADPVATRQAVTTLRDIGVRISLDDFGTGYSSLGYLSQLAVDEIKIDRSFIHTLERESKNRALVRATIEMGHALGAAVVAEGVETIGALKLLTDLGCDRVQGYHVCRPLKADDVDEWLRKETAQADARPTPEAAARRTCEARRSG